MWRAGSTTTFFASASNEHDYPSWDGQQRSLTRIFRRLLERNPRGKQAVSLYKEDRQRGREALIKYLDSLLKNDEALVEEMAGALGKSRGRQFITVVTNGGSVGQVLNVGELDRLVNNYYLFSSVGQVFSFLFGIVAIASAALLGMWWNNQPARMTGDFNIAVAEFSQTGDDAQAASIISQRIFSYLDGQYKSSSFQDVQVAHDKIGLVSSAEEAGRLAEKINAHLVIYGDVTVQGEQVLVSPQFYVVRGYQNDLGEINGEYQLAGRIQFLVNKLLDPADPAYVTLQGSATILTEFTKALVFLTAGEQIDLDLARESIKLAIRESEKHPDFDGKEVLYLFASDIAMRQGNLLDAQAFIDESLRLNDSYGRGYIAQGNIYYNQGRVYEAIETYRFAANLENQPYGAYIQEKASFGIGNGCARQFLYARRNPAAGETDITRLANCALEQYQGVIDAYKNRRNPDDQLNEMAAWAYYYMGVIYQESGQPELSRQALEQVDLLTTNAGLKAKVKTRLKK